MPRSLNVESAQIQSLLFFGVKLMRGYSTDHTQAAANAINSRISPATHFNGAAALIQQRKNGRHMTELSKRILIAIRSNIVSLFQIAKIP